MGIRPMRTINSPTLRRLWAEITNDGEKVISGVAVIIINISLTLKLFFMLCCICLVIVTRSSFPVLHVKLFLKVLLQYFYNKTCLKNFVLLTRSMFSRSYCTDCLACVVGKFSWFLCKVTLNSFQHFPRLRFRFTYIAFRAILNFQNFL